MSLTVDFSSGPALRRAAANVLLERAAEMRRAERERKELAERLDEVRENCKTLHGFIRESWHVLEPRTDFKDNWHIGAVCDHLEAVNKRQIPLLQINMPPGTMKSFTVSVAFNPWEWGPCGMPGMRYITTSYREDLTNRDSRKSRNLIKSEWYQTLWPTVQLTRAGDSEFENTAFGRRKAIPFMSLTGDRGNRVIIDDPHSLKQAESEVERPATVQLFREMVPSRVNDPVNDSIIVMMQRTHPEDVCGVIEELGMPVVRLILPMEFNRSLTVKTPWFTDPRTKEGELLHPERYPGDKLAKDKIFLGPHAYDTQYQQMPRARAGSYFFSQEQLLEEQPDKTFRPVARPTNCDIVFAVVDSASKVGKERDGTGVKYFAYTRHPVPSCVVLDWDIVQIQANLLSTWLPGVINQCEAFAAECGARSGSAGVYVEDKDSGVALIQEATSKQLPVQAIASEFTALGKHGRAVSVGGYVNNKWVRFCEQAFTKTTVYKGRTRNHALHQVTTYRVGVGTPNDEDELFDCFCYGLFLVFGDLAAL